MTAVPPKSAAPAPGDADARILDRLHAVIEKRKGADPKSSWTAKLLARGRLKCAQKLGEEAVETVIAAAAKDRAGVVLESADMLYHWLVTLTAVGVRPEEVWAELRRREGVSGVDEKAARADGAPRKG